MDCSGAEASKEEAVSFDLFSTIFALMKMLTEPSRLITSKILFLEQDVTAPPYFTFIQIMSELIGLWRRRVPRTSAVASKT